METNDDDLSLHLPMALSAPTGNGRQTRVSKAFSNVLRHTAEDKGLKIRPDGYIRLRDLLQLPMIKTCR